MWYLYKKKDLPCICCSVFSTKEWLLEYMKENNLSLDEYDYMYLR